MVRKYEEVELRTALDAVTTTLEDLLNKGFPPKGRSMEDRLKHDQWHDHAREVIRSARKMLQPIQPRPYHRGRKDEGTVEVK